jgi:hypothetical protein
MVAVKASPRRAINSRSTAHAATLVAVVITEIVIMAIGVAVLSLAVVVTVRVPEARLFGKATHILTFHVIGDSMPVVVSRGALWLPQASWPNPLVTGRRMNRRNFTDFKIVGLEISDLSWT